MTDHPREVGATVAQAIHVVAGGFSNQGSFLACIRAPGKNAAEQWEFSGSKIDPGESREESLVRKLLEELNVAVNVGPLIDRSTTQVGALEIDLTCFEVTALAGLQRTSSDHDELRWVTVPELLKLAWATPDLPAVNALKHRGA